MGTFTIPLKSVIKLTGGTIEIVNGISVMTGGNIGLNDYPIFDSAHRPPLNGRIIDHFMNREIGTETIDMFQLFMRRKMNEIMPYYNQLYNSELITIEALSTVNLHTVNSVTDEQTSTATGDSSATSDATGGSRSVTSETPQTQLSGNGDYATGGVDVNSVNNNTSSGTQTNNEERHDAVESDATTTGYQGAASDLLIRYRETFLNIDVMVIAELEELFMGVWDNGDSYTTERGILI